MCLFIFAQTQKQLAVADLDIKATFDNCSNKLILEDLPTINWTSGNITLLDLDVNVDVRISFKVFFNGSTIYSGNTDIVVDSIISTSSTSNPFTLNLQTNSAGEILNGTYEIETTFSYIRTSSNPADIPISKSLKLEYEQPELCVNVEVDCGAELFKIEETSGGYEYKGIVPSTEERLITLTPPSDITESPQTSSTKTLFTNEFYTNTNQVDVSVDLEWDLNDEFYLKDCLSYHKDVSVKCDETLCSLLCCVENLRIKTFRAKTKNRGSYADLLSKLSAANSLITLFQTASKCTNTSVDKNEIVAEIEHLTGCSCSNCGCDGNGKSTKVKGTTTVPIQSKQNIKINQLIQSQTSTYQNSALEGLSSQDFMVYVDGLSVSPVQLNSTTGTLTFPNTLFPNQQLTIWIIKL